MLRAKKGLRKQNVVGHRFDNIQGLFPSFERRLLWSQDTKQRATAHWKCKCIPSSQWEQTPSSFLSFHHVFLLLGFHFALFFILICLSTVGVWEKRRLTGGCVQKYWGLWNIYQSNNDSLDRVSGGRRRVGRGVAGGEGGGGLGGRSGRVKSVCLLFCKWQGRTEKKEAYQRLWNFFFFERRKKMNSVTLYHVKYQSADRTDNNQ